MCQQEAYSWSSGCGMLVMYGSVVATSIAIAANAVELQTHLIVSQIIAHPLLLTSPPSHIPSFSHPLLLTSPPSHIPSSHPLLFTSPANIPSFSLSHRR